MCLCVQPGVALDSETVEVWLEMDAVGDRQECGKVVWKSVTVM
jgi:hypothetical protein